MKTLVKSFFLRFWFPVLIIVLWQMLLQNSTNPYFPAPSEIFTSARSTLTWDWVSTSLKSSLTTLLGGYFIGAILGILLGAVIGSQEFLRAVFTPITNFIRSIPAVAKVPVIMALLGIGTASRICSVSVAVLFPVLMVTLRAVATTDEQLLDNARLMGYGTYRTIFSVRLPAATGQILAGLQAAVQVALFIMVISEMLGSGIGLGAFVIHSQQTFMIEDMWTGILILGALGLFLNEAFLFLERRIAPWYFKSKELR